MQTKRERVERGASHSAFTAVSFEQIQESFLKEDFSSVDRLSSNYLSGHPGVSEAEEARYLRALALLKLGRLEDGRAELVRLEGQNASQDMKERSAGSLKDSYPGSSTASLSCPTPTFGTASGSAVTPTRPLRQIGMEENSLYCVQVGSFSRQLNAERLLNRLLRNRYDAYLNNDAARLVRVRVGHLATRDEAAKLEGRLKKDGYPTKIFP